MNNSSILITEDGTDSASKFGFNPGPLLAVEMFISMVCLVLTCVVYLKIPNLKNVPGKIIVCICSCLFFTYLFLICDFGIRKAGKTTACLIVGFMIHFSFLTMFMWTNVMSYDIWRTLKNAKPGTEPPYAQKKRFIIYSIYSWTSSIVLTTITFIVDNLDSVPADYKPLFGEKRCWLSGTPAFLIYFNLPVGLTLLANFIFFIHTMVILHKHKKQTKMAKQKKHAKQRFMLNIKLLAVMGLIWFAEYLPWITNVYKLYLLSGMLTSLYGVFLFILFVCKKRIWRLIKKNNLCCCVKATKGGSKPSFSSSSNPTSSTSQSSWYVKSAATDVTFTV